MVDVVVAAVVVGGDIVAVDSSQPDRNLTLSPSGKPFAAAAAAAAGETSLPKRSEANLTDPSYQTNQAVVVIAIAIVAVADERAA